MDQELVVSIQTQADEIRLLPHGLGGMEGRLGHGSVEVLQAALAEVLPRVEQELLIDFSRLNWLDSSAIGFLLVARAQLEAKGKRLVLVNCRGMLLELLQRANFHKIFELREA